MTDNLPQDIGKGMVSAPDIVSLIKSLDDHIPEQHIYPSNMDERITQRVILMPSLAKLTDGPNGDKYQYIAFIARGYPRCAYAVRTFTDGQVFPIMFPRLAAQKMFADAMLVDYLSEMMMTGKLYELHFKKMNQTTYKVLFLAEVEPKEDIDVVTWRDLKAVRRFQRTNYLFKQKSYKPEKIE